MNYDEDFEYAQENLLKMQSSLPKSLLGREAVFAERLSNSKLGPLKKLESIYSFLSELSTHINKSTPCRKGCSDCCHYPVSITDIEIQYIEKNTRFKKSKKPINIEKIMGSPCPFLKNSACLIYESRPFVCRRHFVFTKTSQLCPPEICNDNETPLLRISSVEDAFKNIRIESGSADQNDIRTVFKTIN